MTPVTDPQNRNGATILGIRFPKNSLIVQTRPNDNAPANIKNKSTPNLKQFPVICAKIHLKEGIALYSAITCILVTA